MKRKQKPSDFPHKESFPYGQPRENRASKVLHKDRTADELAWSEHSLKSERLKDMVRVPSAPAIKSTNKRIKSNRNGTQIGYNPYESGQLMRFKNPGVRRNLRELGQWLKSQPAKRKV